MTSEILQCFMNVNLGCGHNGLSELAKRHGMSVRNLKPGEYLVFINSAKNRIKVYAANNVIAYYKGEGRNVIDMRTIQMIPRVFNGSSKLNYDEALKLAVEKSLADKKLSNLQVYASARAAGVMR